MKIWQGYLALEYDWNKENFYTWFAFLELEKNDKDQYWISEDGYSMIPFEMTIGSSFGDTCVYQCFDRELSKKEQELLEIKMKVYLKEYLRKENERMNKQYENEMAAIKF